jgi:hypothetical protein
MLSKAEHEDDPRHRAEEMGVDSEPLSGSSKPARASPSIPSCEKAELDALMRWEELDGKYLSQ